MVIMFPSKAKADELCQEIAVTPSGVILWAGNSDYDFNFDSPTNVISYLEGVDGRCAICHNFSEDDVEFLTTYLDGLAVIADSLPSDWQYQQDAYSTNG